MARYADRTDTPIGRTKDEVERTVARYGGEQVSFVWLDRDTEAVLFLLGGYRVMLRVARLTEEEARAIPRASSREAYRTADGEHRRRWRSLLLRLKARLEDIADEGMAVEEALLPYLMLPDNSTVGDRAIPQIREARRSGEMPEMLVPGLPGPPKPTVIALPEKAG